MAQQIAADPVEAAANVMKRQRAGVRSQSSGQLDELNKTLKAQNASQKLKRTPSVQDKVRANDSVAMILAKVYAIVKKEQETNKVYQKQQTSAIKNLAKDFTDVIKKTSDNIKKAIEKSVKVNEELLKENKKVRQENKLFQEETQQETVSKESKRQKEMLSAEDKRHKELISILKKIEKKTAPITEEDEDEESSSSKGKGKKRKKSLKIGDIKDQLKEKLLSVVLDPKAIAAAATGALIIAAGEAAREDIQSSERSAQSAAQRGDLAGLDREIREANERTVRQSVTDPRDEEGVQAALKTMNTPKKLLYEKRKRLKEANTPESKRALDVLDAQEEKRVLMESRPKDSAAAKKFDEDNKAKIEAIDKRIKQPILVSSSTGYSLPVENTEFGSGYGTRTRGGKIESHQGVDLKMPVDTPILAANSGEVIFVGEGSGGAGETIKIKHDDGKYTSYSHLSKSNVKVEQRVTKGQEIGRSGGKKGAPGAGNSEGPHLHFAAYDEKGKFIDPKTLIPELSGAKKGDNVIRSKDSATTSSDSTATQTQATNKNAEAVPGYTYKRGPNGGRMILNDKGEFVEEPTAAMDESKTYKGALREFEKELNSDPNAPKLNRSAAEAAKYESYEKEAAKKFIQKKGLDLKKAKQYGFPVSSITPVDSNNDRKISSLIDAERMSRDLASMGQGMTNNFINQTQIASGGGGGGGSSVPPASVRDNNVTIMAALYGQHNVRMS
jgi:murein DD-endopeptidase MepM/ murein hydrolase activator NlpD